MEPNVVGSSIKFWVHSSEVCLFVQEEASVCLFKKSKVFKKINSSYPPPPPHVHPRTLYFVVFDLSLNNFAKKTHFVIQQL